MEAGNGVVIISNDPSEGLGVVYVIDVHNPALPKIPPSCPTATSRRSTGRSRTTTAAHTGHIANCIKGCQVAVD